MFLPNFLNVLRTTPNTQVDLIKIFLIFVHKILNQKEYVCLLLKLWLPGINPELMTECKLIAHPTWQHCLVMKDQWDWVLKDLEELGNTRNVWKNQHSTGFFLVSSSSCQANFKFAIRSVMTIQKKFLKIIFDSPEFNRPSSSRDTARFECFFHAVCSYRARAVFSGRRIKFFCVL